MSFINVSLLNVASVKARAVSLPRSMTVAELQALAPKNVSFLVDGCTPAGATTLGDLYDACATAGTLEVRFVPMVRMGEGICTPCCACGYEGVDAKELQAAGERTMQDIQNSALAAAQEAARQAAEDAQNNLNNSLGNGNLPQLS